jgi:hypothetical protein
MEHITNKVGLKCEDPNFLLLTQNQLTVPLSWLPIINSFQAPFQWGGKEEQKAEHDLRGRGLCLVPVSCTPQVFQGNSLPDCWMPAYKSPLYRWSRQLRVLLISLWSWHWRIGWAVNGKPIVLLAFSVFNLVRNYCFRFQCPVLLLICM